MCNWVIVNGRHCRTQEELSLEMGCCIYISGEPHGQPPDNSCLCCIDVPRMAGEVGMSCKRPPDAEEFYEVSWVVTSEPKPKSFTECYEQMKELGPTGWDGLPNIQEEIDELR